MAAAFPQILVSKLWFPVDCFLINTVGALIPHINTRPCPYTAIARRRGAIHQYPAFTQKPVYQ
ncbi:hypothetical protein AGMMS49991_01560 [Spirochaetia bacterium]|nr:hypothetical protein AGMMS49991_01560 [Spirochaetia bacterium]